ncbi:hypothetical protein [Natrinema pallidum]|uniref:Uncharacterized protein n=1 Tax=Natrinema pallidum DSM 3751 TaxID=1227495 RepID=L9YHN2_9EURY|nr:hypothetical protein [Natrinema pallidum]ELY73211.1 hypothetical protein C487_17455 [Natrinema pallidum DSM 3751]
MTLSLEAALLSGLPIGVGQIAHCDCCGACLRPNHRVEVLVTIAGTEIDPATTRCLSCARGSIHSETKRSCLLARGRVAGTVDAAGHSQLILSSASVIDRTE